MSGFNLGANGNTYFNYVNNELNETKAYNYSGGINLSKYKAKKYSISFRAGPNYNTSGSSLQKQLNDNGWGLSGNGNLSAVLTVEIRNQQRSELSVYC